MIALVQRVTSARVEVDGRTVAAIGQGMLALVCAQRGDGDSQADALLARVLAYRLFDDGAGRMNRSLAQVEGGLLVVPQFTLAADTRSGLRPSFTPAAPPEVARRLFERFVAGAIAAHRRVEAGIFGAAMHVHLVNDGPVTFWLQVDPAPPDAEGGLR
jgi:D-aminoacyl-tRNA deacylase